jgi:hypothetical protein
VPLPASVVRSCRHFPPPIHVGDLKTAAIRITNRATGINAAENLIVSGIFITPSCAAIASSGVSCATPDLGVFQFSTVYGSAGSSCENRIFTIGQPNGATGEFELIPHVGQSIVLGPANGSGPLPSYCEISINFKVLRLPVDSTPADAPIDDRQSGAGDAARRQYWLFGLRLWRRPGPRRFPAFPGPPRPATRESRSAGRAGPRRRRTSCCSARPASLRTAARVPC